MLKIIKLSDLALETFKTDDNEIVGVGGRVNEIIKNSSKFKKLKNNKSENLIYVLNIRAIQKFIFLTLNAKKSLNILRQIFITAPIF